MTPGGREGRRVELPGAVSQFQVAPGGHFLYRDNPKDEFIGITGWMTGHLRDPKRLTAVECPAAKGEGLNTVRISNKGDRVAWCLYHPEKRMGRLAITDVETGKVVFDFTRPLVADAVFAFGKPGWSADDQRLAVLYLQSIGTEGDRQPMAMLLGVDLAARQARAILPEAFWLETPGAHRPCFAPGGDWVMFPKGEPKPFGDYWPHIVGFDGQGLRMAKDVIYLDDGRHVVADLRADTRPDGVVWMSGLLRDATTGQAERLGFPAGPRGGSWSVDGRWQAQSEVLPWNKRDASNWSIISLVNTRTGEVTEWTRMRGVIDASDLEWVRY